MKISYINTCIATALLATSYQATANDVTVYGKANVTLSTTQKESKDTDQWEFNSNASRLGVKGKYELNDELTAIYKMEFEVYLDDGDKNGKTFSQRNIYAGLKGDFGTFIVGRHDTPLKLAQGKVDRFNDQLGDIKNYMEGEDRVSNIAMYTTPIYSGFSATLAVIPGEDSANGKDGIADGNSLSVKYKMDGLTASISKNSDIDGQDTVRFVTEASIDKLKLGALWQTAEKVDSTNEEDSWLISGEYKLGNGYSVKAQYGMTDYQSSDHNHKEDSQIAFGVDKKFTKNAKLFAFYSTIEKELDGEVIDDSSFSVGVELKF